MALSQSTDRFNKAVFNIALKAPCEAVSIANITLSGEQTVNGTAVVSGDRVLVAAQTDPVENGIYDVATGPWTRALDFDGNRDVTDGTLVTVRRASGRHRFYQLDATNPVVIGTTSLAFTPADGANVSYSLTTAEGDEGLTENDIDDSWPEGHWHRYGAVGDGIADDTTAILTSFAVVKQAGDGISQAEALTYNITATLEFDPADLITSIIIQGKGSGPSGTVIQNTTNDVPAIYINGDISDQSNVRADRVSIRDLRINHEAATKYAVVAEEAPYLFMNNVKIECNSVGFGALFMGSTTIIPDSDNFLSSIEDCDFRNFTTVGVRVNSKGHTFDFKNCKVGGGGAGAYDGWFQTEGVNLYGGQWGGSPNGVTWDNQGAGDIEFGSMHDNKFEGVGSGEVGVRITGTNASPKDFQGIYLENVATNMAVMDGTLVEFDYARQCKLLYPILNNPTLGSGVLVHWTANSDQCELLCDYVAAQAALNVNASATRAVKRVTGQISRAQVDNITTYANLTTILADGVDDLTPGFTPVHNGTAWNNAVKVLPDDTAVAIPVPFAYGHAIIMQGDDIATWGRVDFETVTPAIRVVDAGADFETATGILVGDTGTNAKVTASPHTDGNLYVECRKGAANLTVLFLGPNF